MGPNCLQRTAGSAVQVDGGASACQWAHHKRPGFDARRPPRHPLQSTASQSARSAGRSTAGDGVSTGPLARLRCGSAGSWRLLRPWGWRPPGRRQLDPVLACDPLSSQVVAAPLQAAHGARCRLWLTGSYLFICLAAPQGTLAAWATVTRQTASARSPSQCWPVWRCGRWHAAMRTRWWPQKQGSSLRSAATPTVRARGGQGHLGGAMPCHRSRWQPGGQAARAVKHGKHALPTSVTSCTPTRASLTHALAPPHPRPAGHRQH